MDLIFIYRSTVIYIFNTFCWSYTTGGLCGGEIKLFILQQADEIPVDTKLVGKMSVRIARVDKCPNVILRGCLR